MYIKCAIDRFYPALYPKAPKCLKKTAMFLSSGDADMYDGANRPFHHTIDKFFLSYIPEIEIDLSGTMC